MIYKPFDIIVVPFPFTDSDNAKKRPAIILSSNKQFGEKIGHSVAAMITSARHTPWPGDVKILGLLQAGLPKPSIIRMKLFTIDHRLIIEKIGTLTNTDKKSFTTSFKEIFKDIL